MTNQSTIDKLIEMRLTAMADAFRIQMDDPTMKEVPFEDRFGMLVDVEYSNRKNNRLKRLIRQAELEQPDASIAAIDYHSGRKLNKALINRLATCEYITEYWNIFITGATGSGKTYMACAFGMEACKQYYNTKYIRLPDLLIDLEVARTDGNYNLNFQPEIALKASQAEKLHVIGTLNLCFSHTHIMFFRKFKSCL